jgi:hypothetical protein
MSTSKASAPPESTLKDSFQEIKGIGPAIERSLHEAGILTFDQLASLTPQEVFDAIASAGGLSVERISQQNWIGQARALKGKTTAATKVPTPTEKPVETEERQHYATFTVEYLLDEENQVRRTRVVHIQSGQEKAWAGWQENRLANFLTRLTLPAKSDPATQMNPASGKARLTKLEVIPTTGAAARHLLHGGQPFEVRLTVDLSQVAIPENQSLAFAATVYARDMTDTSQQVVGKRRGAVAPANETIIPVSNLTLPAGVYRLEAAVELSWLSQEPYLQVMLEGNLLQVY